MRCKEQVFLHGSDLATAVSAGLFKSLPFDPVHDFAPISTLGFFDIAIVVPAESKFKTLVDLQAHARAHPGQLNLGSVNIGSTQHLAAELFKTNAGADVQIAPFNGTPAVITVLPDVPTARASGLPTFVVSSWNALAVPARTPRAVIARLNKEVAAALRAADVTTKLNGLNVQARASSPEQAAELLASEIKRWSEVITRAKIQKQWAAGQFNEPRWKEITQ